MNELIEIRNKQAVTTSLQIAEVFGKKHSNVIRAIDNVLKNELVKKLFMKGSYIDSKGEKRPMYYMNRDGFSLLAMGFTGKKALEWKIMYINAFNTMEALLNEKSTENWIETRRYGKITRKAETDVIQQLIGYAKAQGSTHSEMMYMTYSKLANKIAGISNRDFATIRQLNNLDTIERIILFEIEMVWRLSLIITKYISVAKHK